MRAGLFLFFVASAFASSPVDPASVLVVYQANTGPETGTGAVNASQWVAEHYMTARSIPVGNIVAVSTFIEQNAHNGFTCTPGGSCDLTHTASTNISYASYLADVLAPIQAKLAANGGTLAASIKYIVPVYGVPITIISKPTIPSGTMDGGSIDSAIAALAITTILGKLDANPYWVAGGLGLATSTPLHIDQITFAQRLYLVSRLDGPTAAISAALVDKAIAAEAGINVRSGVSYFDWQGIFSDPYDVHATATQECDGTIHEAWALCSARSGWNCTLNNQTQTGTLLASAPNTLFYAGWYTLASLDIWTFAPGAVATFNNSNSANSNSIRAGGSGSMVEVFLRRGVTATWGVTAEPFTTQLPRAQSVFNHLWMGYTFGEAVYIGTPKVNWMNVNVGDPLYRPKFIGPQHAGRGVSITGGVSIH